MSELFKITDDRKGEKEVTSVDFDPIPVGATSKKEVFIQNETPAVLQLRETMSQTNGSGTIDIVTSPETVDKGDFERVELKARPINDNQLQGLEATISIEASAVIDP